MSEVTRWAMSHCIIEHEGCHYGYGVDPKGEWVRYSDYAALSGRLKKAERERDVAMRALELSQRGMGTGMPAYYLHEAARQLAADPANPE